MFTLSNPLVFYIKSRLQVNRVYSHSLTHGKNREELNSKRMTLHFFSAELCSAGHSSEVCQINNSTIVLRFHRKSIFLTSQVNVVSIHVWFKSGLSQRVFSWLQSATCNTQFKSSTPSLKSEHDVH